MLTSSLFVLTALTMTGVYVKGNNAKEQKEEYRLDFSQLEQGQDADGLMVKNQNPMVEEAPNNDLDYEPDLEEVGSVNVQNPERWQRSPRQTIPGWGIQRLTQKIPPGAKNSRRVQKPGRHRKVTPSL